ncbi:GyrI-like domain-containing protein [Staphylococcus cohnii]|uniref:GyrI-like domain-containing protein n=1 Tax=Staphylococcus cohnii TaxID=29382 RepID=UPI003CE98E1B
MGYRIETLSERPVPVVGVKKKYATGQKAQENIFKFWMEFEAMGYKDRLISQSNQYLEGLLGVCLPKENGEMHYLIGVTRDEQQSEWEQVDLVEGRYLVFDAKGPVPESIKQAMQTIHRNILHTLDYELRSAPFFELYKPGELHSNDYITEIWFPIK